MRLSLGNSGGRIKVEMRQDRTPVPMGAASELRCAQPLAQEQESGNPVGSASAPWSITQKPPQTVGLPAGTHISLERQRAAGQGFSLSLFFFFVFFFRAAPTAYGGSQARGPIGTTAGGLHHSHSNAGSELCL